MPWEDEFRRRIKEFEISLPADEDILPVSIKIRVSSGCFHREHSRHAYRLIDEYLDAHPSPEISFQEHESGPELLVYLSLAAAGISLSANVVNLVTAIIKARSEGIKKGDRPDYPLELIVRGFDEEGHLREEKVLRIDPQQQDVSKELIESALKISATNLLPKGRSKKKRGV
jgi:hypothetical protein